MTKDQFHTLLHDHLHRQPFAPFAVELRDGRRVVVRQLPVVYSDGAASFIDPEDGALVDFTHDQVRAFGPLEQEARA